MNPKTKNPETITDETGAAVQPKPVRARKPRQSTTSKKKETTARKKVSAGASTQKKTTAKKQTSRMRLKEDQQLDLFVSQEAVSSLTPKPADQADKTRDQKSEQCAKQEPDQDKAVADVLTNPVVQQTPELQKSEQTQQQPESAAVDSAELNTVTAEPEALRKQTEAVPEKETVQTLPAVTPSQETEQQEPEEKPVEVSAQNPDVLSAQEKDRQSSDALTDGIELKDNADSAPADSESKTAANESLLPQLCRSLWAKLAVVLIVIALCCSLPYWWYFKRVVALPQGVPYVDVTVPSGASGRAIANSIAQAGIGVSPDTLIGLLRVQGTPLAIHAGRYRFVPGMTLADIVQKLQSSDVEKFSFRIADGQSIWSLRKAVSELADIEIRSADMTDAQLRNAIGVKEPHLEGVFAPETYNFRTGITDIDVYRAAYREQMRILEQEWNQRSPEAMAKNPYEALILASIIEKETSLKTDRALVSSVFNNRLRLKMPLQTDPTIIYGIGEEFNGNLTRKDMQQPGPYNTYLNAGLPPTPISMPSAASIHAALNPRKTKYLYFVAKGDGTTYFSTSLTEHNRAVEKYQKAPARKARALKRRLKQTK